MLRRNNELILEFPDVELLLRDGASAGRLSAAQQRALLDRILARLGTQDAPRSWVRDRSPRWLAVPVGAGIAATIIAASAPMLRNLLDAEGEGGATVVIAGGTLEVVGLPAVTITNGQTAEAVQYASLFFQRGRTRLDLEEGTRITLLESGPRLAFQLLSGEASVTSIDTPIRVEGNGWVTTLTGGTALFRTTAGREMIQIVEGTVRVSALGMTCEATAGQAVEIADGVCTVR